jgi:hypothetical protein
MTIEKHIEELRAELRNACEAYERRAIEVELECAQAELAIIVAGQDGRLDVKPPSWADSDDRDAYATPWRSPQGR